MTAVIYARYSSSSQREASIEEQVRICKQFADRNGYMVAHVYKDSAITGKTDKRPEFQLHFSPSSFSSAADFSIHK